VRHGAEAKQPAGAVLAAGVEECIAFDNGAESIADRRERIDRAMRLALGAQLRQLEIRLPFLATLGSAAPFIGLFGTVWGIMRSFNARAEPSVPFQVRNRKAPLAVPKALRHNGSVSVE
jgi:biopolymer transport protein TolQ